jgi:protein gp37
MAKTSKIEWIASAWNPWIGCQHVSPGCDHCYAEDGIADGRYRRMIVVCDRASHA